MRKWSHNICRIAFFFSTLSQQNGNVLEAKFLTLWVVCPVFVLVATSQFVLWNVRWMALFVHNEYLLRTKRTWTYTAEGAVHSVAKFFLYRSLLRTQKRHTVGAVQSDDSLVSFRCSSLKVLRLGNCGDAEATRWSRLSVPHSVVLNCMRKRQSAWACLRVVSYVTVKLYSGSRSSQRARQPQ